MDAFRFLSFQKFYSVPLTFFLLLLVSPTAQAQTTAGSVNLTNYGVLCDGVHPTNTAFVSAIAALGSAGGTINVPAGMCLITTNSLGGFSGTWPVNSTTVTITSSLGTAGITVGMTVSSTSAGIQTDSVVTAVNPSSITISKPTTSAQTTGVSLAFTQGLIFANAPIVLAGPVNDASSASNGATLLCATGSANCVTFVGDYGGGMHDIGISAAQINLAALGTVSGGTGGLMQTSITAIQSAATTTTGATANMLNTGTASPPGLAPGYQITFSSPGVIAAGTYVQYVGFNHSGSTAANSNTITVSGIANVVVGATVTDTGGCVPSGAKVTAILTNTSVQISAPSSGTPCTGDEFLFAGGNGIITMSAPATSAASGTASFFPFIPVAGNVVAISGVSSAAGNSQAINGGWVVSNVSAPISGVITFDLANASNNGPVVPYTFQVTCNETGSTNQLTICGYDGGAYSGPPNIFAAGQTVTGSSGNTTVASVPGSTLNLASTITVAEPITFTNAYTASSGGGSVQGFQIQPGYYDLVIMGSSGRMSFERVNVADGMNGMNLLNSGGTNFLYTQFVGFYDQQAILLNGASDAEEPQGFNCYQCTVSSKNPTSDNVVFDGNTASNFIRDSYIAQNARNGIWFRNTYGRTDGNTASNYLICPGALQIAGSGVGEAAFGTGIRLDCGQYVMIHDVLDFNNIGSGTEGFGLIEGAGYIGDLTIDANIVKGAHRDGLRLGSGYATIVGNEITANGNLNTAGNALQIQGIAEDTANANQVEIRFAPGSWAPSARDRVLIANAPANTGINSTTWSVQPISATQFDLIGSTFAHGCSTISGPMCVGASGTLTSAQLRADAIRIMPGATGIKISSNTIEPRDGRSGTQDYGVYNDGTNPTTSVSITAVAAGAQLGASNLDRLTLSSAAGLITGDRVTISSYVAMTGPSLNGNWAVNIIDSTHVDLQYSDFQASTSVTAGSLAPATQTELSVENNAMTGNSIAPYFSNSTPNAGPISSALDTYYSSNVRFRMNSNMEQQDINYFVQNGATTATTPVVAALVAGKVYITQISAAQSGTATCLVKPYINGTVVAGIASLSVPASGAVSTLTYSPGFLVNGSSTSAVALQYEFSTGCSTGATASVQFQGIKID